MEQHAIRAQEGRSETTLDAQLPQEVHQAGQAPRLVSSIQLNACHNFIASQLDIAVHVIVGKYADVACTQLSTPEPCHHNASISQCLHNAEAR